MELKASASSVPNTTTTNFINLTFLRQMRKKIENCYWERATKSKVTLCLTMRIIRVCQFMYPTYGFGKIIRDHTMVITHFTYHIICKGPLLNRDCLYLNRGPLVQTFIQYLMGNIMRGNLNGHQLIQHR